MRCTASGKPDRQRAGGKACDAGGQEQSGVNCLGSGLEVSKSPREQSGVS